MMDFADDWVFGPMNLIDRLQGLIMGAIYQDKRIYGILGRHGIKCWGWGHGGFVDEYYFRVSLDRGAHAMAILRKVGAPIVHDAMPKTSRKRRVNV